MSWLIAPLHAVAKAAVSPMAFVVDVAKGDNVGKSAAKMAGSVLAPVVPIIAAPVNLGKDLLTGRNALDAVGDCFVSSIPGGDAVRTELRRKKGARVLLYDDSRGRGILGVSWDIGSSMERGREYFDHCVGVRSWDEAAKQLEAIGARERIYEVQYWGHGAPMASNWPSLEMTRWSRRPWATWPGSASGASSTIVTQACSGCARAARSTRTWVVASPPICRTTSAAFEPSVTRA
jgi:hypothetical protein